MEPFSFPRRHARVSGYKDVDRRQDSLACPVDHSPSSDIIPPPTASADREVLGITAADPTEQQDIYDVGKNPNPHDEIEKIEETTEGLRIAQSNEEAAV